MAFPPLAEQMSIVWVGLVIATAIFVMGTVILRKWYFSSPRVSSVLLAAFVCLAIGGVILYSIGCQLFFGYEIRRRLARPASSIVIHRLRDESSQEDPHALAIDDPQQFRKLLAELPNCKACFRNHETYSDGYLVRIQIPESQDVVLKLFTASSRGGLVDVVIPVTGVGQAMNAGEFSCPTFVRGIEQCMKEAR